MPGPNTYDGVINEVLNSTDPTVYDDKRAQTLESAIKTGDQADPRGGYSYLDNIAKIITNPGAPAYAAVLLDQLTGRMNTRDYGGDKKSDAGPIPTNPYPGPPFPFHGASDITDDPRNWSPTTRYNIPLIDPSTRSVPQSRRRT